jgi:hypothetical protein
MWYPTDEDGNRHERYCRLCGLKEVEYRKGAPKVEATTYTNIRRKAIAAREAREEEWEKARAEEIEKKRAFQSTSLKNAIKRRLDIDCEPNGPAITLEGVDFFVDGHGNLRVSAPCDYPQCEGLLISGYINSWEDLGYALQGHYEHHSHYTMEDGEVVDLPRRAPVNNDPPPRTSADVLLDALRAFIRDYTQVNEA